MPPDVRLGSDCTTELDCVGTVKTPSTVIPALHRCVTQGSLGDRNALPLTAADTTNKVITNSSIPRVGYTKHCHRNMTEMADIFLARSSMGGLQVQRVRVQISVQGSLVKGSSDLET